MEHADNTLVITDTELSKLRNSLASAVRTIDAIVGHKNLTKPPREIKKYVDIDYIVNGVCSYYDITIEDLRTYRRNPALVERRKITAFLLRKYTKASLALISTTLGYRSNGCTILPFLKDMEMSLTNEMYGDKNIINTYKELLTYLNL